MQDKTTQRKCLCYYTVNGSIYTASRFDKQSMRTGH